MDYVQGDAQAAKNAYAGAQTVTAVPSDPASLRGQLQALGALAERLACQRSCLKDIADFIVGEQPPDPSQRGLQSLASAGGVTAEIIGMVQHISDLLDDTDQHVRRLQRVSS